MNYCDIFIESQLPKKLNKVELFEFIRQAKQGDLESRNKVIIHNIKLVLNQVKKKFNNVPYEKKELVSVGIIGLIKAVDTFDVTKNYNFSTYAIKCINNEILMFIRKNRSCLEKESFSLEQPLDFNMGGNELKIKDTIADDGCDFDENMVNCELLLEVRRQVEMLNERDKEIVKLYFGFYGDKKYTQSEIAIMTGLSRSYICRIINRVVDLIEENLKEQNLIEGVRKTNGSTKENANLNTREDSAIKVAKKLQTIYEYFNQYTREQIDEMLNNLTEDEKKLITLRYGEDLCNPKTSSNWCKEFNVKFYGKLVPKMKRLLLKQIGETKYRNVGQVGLTSTMIQQDILVKGKNELPLNDGGEVSIGINNSITKEEYVKILELLRTPTFEQMMGLLSPKEAIIISLKLGYVDGKYFSTESIANFLEIEEDEVRETIKKVLSLYKENINEFIDSAIKVATEQTMVLSLISNGKK